MYEPALDDAYQPRRDARRPRGRSGAVAALLSFVWPGLGQAYLRRRGAALMFALPALAVTAGLLIAIVRSPEVFALRLLVPSSAALVVGVIALAGVWRIAAIAEAWLASRRSRPLRPTGLALVAVLSVIVIVSHGLAASYVQSFAGAGERIFGGDGPPPGTSPDPLDDLLGPRESPAPDGTPRPTPTPLPPNPIPRQGPINILFVGVDSGPDRDHALTDTLIVASFDPESNEIVMISVPRDTGRVPLFDGTTYRNRINSLLGHFRRNPERYPDGAMPTLVEQMSFLIGVPIHYYAVTDMSGLREVVDLVGGVDVVLEDPIRDPRMPLNMDPGAHHLDGQHALMYARSRYGPGNSDFVRARRQQQLIRALANRIKQPAVLARLPDVLDAGAKLVRSDVPVEQLPEILELLDRSEGATTSQIVLSPRRYAERIPPSEVGGRYMIQLKMDELARLSIDLFGERSRYWSAEGDPLSGPAPD